MTHNQDTGDISTTFMSLESPSVDVKSKRAASLNLLPQLNKVTDKGAKTTSYNILPQFNKGSLISSQRGSSGVASERRNSIFVENYQRRSTGVVLKEKLKLETLLESREELGASLEIENSRTRSSFYVPVSQEGETECVRNSISAIRRNSYFHPSVSGNLSKVHCNHDLKDSTDKSSFSQSKLQATYS